MRDNRRSPKNASFLVCRTTVLQTNALVNERAGRFDYRCTVSPSLEDERDQVCGIPASNNSENSLTDFYVSLELLDQPYTCEEVSLRCAWPYDPRFV